MQIKFYTVPQFWIRLSVFVDKGGEEQEEKVAYSKKLKILLRGDKDEVHQRKSHG